LRFAAQIDLDRDHAPAHITKLANCNASVEVNTETGCKFIDGSENAPQCLSALPGNPTSTALGVLRLWIAEH
jgi:hypothetical protein